LEVALFHYFSLIVIALMAVNASANQTDIEEFVVTSKRDTRLVEVSDTVGIAPSAAELLQKAPGANFNGNGPLTSIPQYRGMYGARVNINVNGMSLSSGGPNWMDPPLSYAPAAHLASLEVFRGIAPISAGQETIGGAINAKTWSGNFTSSEQFETSGRVRVGGQTVNDASLLSGMLVLANKNHRVKVAAIAELAKDAKFTEGVISPSEYERGRYDIAYGYQTGAHTLQWDLGRNETGEAGTAALPMDIDYIDADLASFHYGYQGSQWVVDSKFYFSEITHGMTNYHLREAPAMASRWRRNTAEGDNLGFSLQATLEAPESSWLLGLDGHSETHNSNIDNINNPMFYLVNFNDAQREVLGLFVEHEKKINTNWQGEFGLRFNRVNMDADEVDGTPAMMPVGKVLRDNFNNADRSRSDNNIDWVAKFYYQSDVNQRYYLGLSRKTRSPAYQESYLWLPMQSTAGLADGHTYTGNLALKPEVAHEFELGVDYHAGSLTVSPRIFYREVNDYIQGTETHNMSAAQFTMMMGGSAPLEFNNVKAEFYGFDMDWLLQLNERWSLNGVVNYVRAKRKDINDNLYRITPLNAMTSLNYTKNDWMLSVESVLYNKQDKVSVTNTEQETAGYGLLNLKGSWQISEALRMGFGMDNAMDKKYENHLSGINRVKNSDVDLGSRLPGYSRNIFARMDYQW
jgi:iron complex outermembrane receptor protein